MNASAKINPEVSGLALMRQPFAGNQLSKLPKPTKAQTDAVKADFKKGIRCKICGAWHHPDVVHLDYVGHAALTNRLLECDPTWNWEPVAFDQSGRPAFDENGGLWIKLTVCGVTRFGYGHPDGKKGGDAVKEVIGDALRNAAMRFGAALDLWHKGDLHADEAEDPEPGAAALMDERPPPQRPPSLIGADQYLALRNRMEEAGVSEDAIMGRYGVQDLQRMPVEAFQKAMSALQATIGKRKAAPPVDDEIPY